MESNKKIVGESLDDYYAVVFEKAKATRIPMVYAEGRNIVREYKCGFKVVLKTLPDIKILPKNPIN